MTVFLWTVVILMAAALLAEVVAMIGMIAVTRRAARRAAAIKVQISEKVNSSVRLMNEIKHTIQPRVLTISQDSREIGLLLTTRYHAAQAAYADASRRAQRIRLRLNDGVQTVEQQRRELHREVMEPIQAAGQIMRGLRLALWFMRNVA